MGRYEIAFSGKLVPGARPELVQANLGKLFQADAQRIAALFSGRRVILKSNLDEAAAEKYRSTLERAGALVEVLPHIRFDLAASRLTAVYPGRRLLSPRVRVFLEFLAGICAG